MQDSDLKRNKLPTEYYPLSTTVLGAAYDLAIVDGTPRFLVPPAGDGGIGNVFDR